MEASGTAEATLGMGPWDEMRRAEGARCCQGCVPVPLPPAFEFPRLALTFRGREK